MPDGSTAGIERDDCPSVFVELDTQAGFVIFDDEPRAPVYRFEAPIPG